MNLIDAIKTVRLFPKEEALIPLETRWGKNLDDQHVLEEYPRPQMIRNNYINLNGYWDYAITPDKSIPPSISRQDIGSIFTRSKFIQS